MHQLLTKSREDTLKFAGMLAKQLQGGEIIFLTGNLGTGKTTFTQGLALALGISERVNSPTFVIMKQYFNLPLSLIHIDAYRLEGSSQDLGFMDYLDDQTVMLIEWPNFLVDCGITTNKIINFNIIDDDIRQISYEGFSEVNL